MPSVWRSLSVELSLREKLGLSAADWPAVNEVDLVEALARRLLEGVTRTLPCLLPVSPMLKMAVPMLNFRAFSKAAIVMKSWDVGGTR